MLRKRKKFRFLRFDGLYTKEKAVVVFTFFYIFLFSALSFSKGNREFIFYSITMLLLLLLGIYVNRQVKLPELTILGLSTLGLLHILGGNVVIRNTRLYDTFFVFDIFRYDNIVHVFGTLLATFVLNTLFFGFSRDTSNIRLGLYYFSLVLMALGVGVFNEIVEFLAVLFFNSEEGVGGYLNNAVDLIYNLIGALVAVIFIDTYRVYKNTHSKN